MIEAGVCITTVKEMKDNFESQSVETKGKCEKVCQCLELLYGM